jgi:hypothetical protein
MKALLPPLRSAAAVFVVFATVCTAAPARAQGDAQAWVPTWAASVQPVREPDFFFPVSIPRALTTAQSSECESQLFSLGLK